MIILISVLIILFLLCLLTYYLFVLDQFFFNSQLTKQQLFALLIPFYHVIELFSKRWNSLK
jgi:hypothetical protein